MTVDIFLAPYEKKHILRNMLEIYLHDLSEFDHLEVKLDLNEAGLYGYGYLDYYWNEPGRYPYLLTVDGKIAGLAFVRIILDEPLTFSIAEFFVVRKYRNLGVGTALINKMFSFHKGNWNIDTAIKNIAAQNFWRKSVKNNATGEIEESIIEQGRRMQWKFSNCISIK
jgi:predicted acetyltransferase